MLTAGDTTHARDGLTWVPLYVGLQRDRPHAGLEVEQPSGANAQPVRQVLNECNIHSSVTYWLTRSNTEQHMRQAG
jgi:hypothetical protein